MTHILQGGDASKAQKLMKEARKTSPSGAFKPSDTPDIKGKGTGKGGGKGGIGG